MNKTVYIKKDDILSFVVAGIVFAFSMLLSPFNTYGDQEFYRRVYDVIPYLRLDDAVYFYSFTLSSNEVVHFSLVYFLGEYFSKELLMSVLNFLLAFVSFKLLVSLGAYKSIALFIVLTNYYMWVLYLPAERLKVACIFVFSAWLLLDKRSRFIILSGLGMLSHVSTIIILIAGILVYSRDELARVFSNLKISRIFFFALPLLIVVLLLSLGQLADKAVAYFQGGEFLTLGEAIRMLAFFFLALLYAEKKSNVVIVFIFLFSMVFLFSGDRVNMFGYLAFLYFSIHYRRGFNLGVMLTSLYFMISTIGLMNNIIVHGDAFFHLSG